MSNQSREKKLKFHIDPQSEGGTYANFSTIFHTETEFLIDFGMLLPGRDSIRIGSRIVMSPRIAKQLSIILNQNISNYENRFGEIKITKPVLPTAQGPDFAQ